MPVIVTRAGGHLPAGRLFRRCLEAAAVASLLAGCTFTFGNSDDGASSGSMTPRERNSLYLRQQEEEARQRQGPTFDNTLIPNR